MSRIGGWGGGVRARDSQYIDGHAILAIVTIDTIVVIDIIGIVVMEGGWWSGGRLE